MPPTDSVFASSPRTVFQAAMLESRDVTVFEDGTLGEEAQDASSTNANAVAQKSEAVFQIERDGN